MCREKVGAEERLLSADHDMQYFGNGARWSQASGHRTNANTIMINAQVE
jgi:hypothetical protein